MLGTAIMSYITCPSRNRARKDRIAITIRIVTTRARNNLEKT